MNTFRTLALAALFALVAQAVSAATITGLVWPGARIAPGADATIIVELLDVSRADARGDVVAATRVVPRGRLRAPFRLDYDAGALHPHFRYVLSARLIVDGRLVARTTSPPRIFAGRPPPRAALRLTPVADGRPPSAERPAGDLAGEWVVESVSGVGIGAARAPTLALRADGRAAGFGGCNRFTGPYTAERSSLGFGALAATRMACLPAAMALEQRYFDALRQTRAFRLEGGVLHLFGPGGAPVARLRRAG